MCASPIATAFGTGGTAGISGAIRTTGAVSTTRTPTCTATGTRTATATWAGARSADTPATEPAIGPEPVVPGFSFGVDKKPGFYRNKLTRGTPGPIPWSHRCRRDSWLWPAIALVTAT